mmetsp:Transcript_348/g.818  ORF Transcript_348/g.818 Transcript_348/m.818 type:complete len:86 (+) Transcript_348:1135-1392(+)
MKLDEAADVDSVALLKASRAFRRASLSSEALSSLSWVTLAAERAESFQLLSSSDVFEERLRILSPISSSLSEPAALDCEILSDDL